MHTDADIFSYFAMHYRTFFPPLSERTSFVRQAVNLHQVKQVIWQRIVNYSEQNKDSLQSQAHSATPNCRIDTLPYPVGGFTRRFRLKCFRDLADVGHCAAKKMTYYGFKIGLRVSSLGMAVFRLRRKDLITHCPLLNARAHDVTTVADFGECSQTHRRTFGNRFGNNCRRQRFP